MNVLLIYPPSLRFAGVQWSCFPLGLGYIAAALLREKHRVNIYNADLGIITQDFKHHRYLSLYTMENLYEKYYHALANSTHQVWKEIEDIVQKQQPEAVGITCKALDMASAMKVAQIVKTISKKTFVIVGGPAATTCTDILLGDPNIDFAVRGEGEMTTIELMRALSNYPQISFYSIDGLSFKDKGNIAHNKARALISNLDCLGFPARNTLLGIDTFSRRIFESLMGDLITSRGCPYRCTFCANFSVWGSRQARFRSAQNIIEEITYLHDTYAIKKFIFWDDHFTTQKKRAIEICESLLEKKLNIEWVCLVRADTVDRELLMLMKRAGCYQVQMGVESGSDRILTLIGKGTTVDQIKKTAAMVKEVGLGLHIFLMMGIPGETKKEIKSTMRLLHEIKPSAGVRLNLFTPYPGTALYEELRKRGFLDGGEWLSLDNCPDTLNINHSYVGTIPHGKFRTLAIKYFKECDRYNAVLNKQPQNYLKNLYAAAKNRWAAFKKIMR